jgi:hypothetical protein
MVAIKHPTRISAVRRTMRSKRRGIFGVLGAIGAGAESRSNPLLSNTFRHKAGNS